LGNIGGGGVQVLDATLPPPGDESARAARLAELDRATVGVTGALASLARFYLLSGLTAEGEQVFEQAIQRLGAGATEDRTVSQFHQQLLAELAEMLVRQSKLRLAVVQAQAVVDLAGSHGDVEGQARGYQLLGYAHAQDGDSATARRHLESGLALAHQAGQTALEGEILRHLGNVTIALGDRIQEESYLEQALQLHRALGN